MRALTLLLLLAAAPAVAAAPGDGERYRQCLDLARSDSARAIDAATAWRGEGGGVPARHCLALAYSARGDDAAAAAELAAAARAAEAAHDAHAADLWGQAGNAALLAKQGGAAIADFTAGITVAGSEPVRLAALLTDRARALVEANRTTEARADLTRATSLDPSSADGWLLLATLDRRLGDLPAAERAILEAARREPGDPDIALEAGNIAGAEGRLDLARTEWKKVVTQAPGSDAAAVAAKALALNPG
ncbi:MAG: tetratricopeptide repeat protein [Sphingomonadaceae bacterium]|nr:tetratricopeptide repeat protein [Sphingomonadaceae bacterium]